MISLKKISTAAYLGYQGRNTNTQVHVVTILDFLRSASGDSMSPVTCSIAVVMIVRVFCTLNGMCDLLLFALCQSEHFDRFGLRCLDDPVHKNTGNVDRIGRQRTGGARQSL